MTRKKAGKSKKPSTKSRKGTEPPSRAALQIRELALRQMRMILSKLEPEEVRMLYRAQRVEEIDEVMELLRDMRGQADFVDEVSQLLDGGVNKSKFADQLEEEALKSCPVSPISNAPSR